MLIRLARSPAFPDKRSTNARATFATPFRYRLAFVLSITLTSALPCLGQNTLGKIIGVITDPSRAVVSGADVSALALDTGRVFKAVTERSGMYVIPDVPIGRYRVTARSAGFGEREYPEIAVEVDQTLRVDLQLTVAGATEVVQVGATEQLLDTADSSLGAALSTKFIETLPINGRDYGRFTLLSPGAVLHSSTLADISFNGLQTTNNYFAIDGIDATRVDYAFLANGSERGARLLLGSLDTIAEFRVQTATYPADYGRAAGGEINIATKSGTNTLHGTAYDFLRSDFFDARNYFQLPGVAVPLHFNDFGANLDGRAIPDKMFYFVNYEGTRQNIGLSGSGTELSPAGQALAVATSPAIAPLIAQMPIPGRSGLLQNVVLTPTTNANVDAVSFTGTLHVQENIGSVRLDNVFGRRDSTFVRVNINNNVVSGPLFGTVATYIGANDHQNVASQTTNIAVGETHVFSPRAVSTFLMGAQRYAVAFDQSVPVPLVSISGLNYTAGDHGLYGREPTDIQFGEAITWVKGSHSIAIGGTNWNISYPFHGFSVPTTLTYSSIANFMNDKVASASVGPNYPLNITRMADIGGYITDTWQATPHLSVTMGLRWDWDQVPYDESRSTSVWSQNLMALTAPGAPYYNNDYTNYGPRLGLAYSAATNIVFRSGFGVYRGSFPIGAFVNKLANTYPGTITLSSANIPTLSYPLTPFLASAVLATPSVTGFSNNIREPLSYQYSASMQLQLAKTTAMTFAYVGNHSQNQEVSEGINFINPVTGKRPYPTYSGVTLDSWDGRAHFNGLQISFRQATYKGISAGAEYSWSHSIANSGDNGASQTQPQQSYNLEAEFGDAPNDVRHNLNFHLLYALPFGAKQQYLGGANPVIRAAVGGWSLSGIGFVRTGIPGTVYLGTNTYGNGNFVNQRPNIVPGVSIYTANHVKNANNTVPYLNVAAFALPTAAIAPTATTAGVPGAFGNSPVGNYLGPRFNQVDSSILKDTPLTEKVNLQLRLEVYNILNHPNFDVPAASSWVPGSTSFGLISNTSGRYVGFGTARQMQISAKLLF